MEPLDNTVINNKKAVMGNLFKIILWIVFLGIALLALGYLFKVFF